MGLESGTFVDDLVTTNPVGASDDVNQGDDHLRLVKTVLKNTFPNASRAFRFELVSAAKVIAYPIVAADERALIEADVSGGAFTVTLPLGSTVFAGFSVWVTKEDSSSNAVTVDGNGAETINGALTITLDDQYAIAKFTWTGSEWRALNPQLNAAALFAGAITLNTGGNTDAVLDEDGLDRSSAGAETYNFINSGAGAMTIQVDGVDVPTVDSIDTFTLKVIDSADNTLTVDLSEATVTGTFAQFNTAVSDETLTALGKIGGFNAQTGTTYTAVLTDIGKAVTMNNASANVLTIPPNSSVAYAVGSWFSIIQIGAGITTVTGGAGVTVNGVSTGGAASPFKFAFITVLKQATDTWFMNVDGVA